MKEKSIDNSSFEEIKIVNNIYLTVPETKSKFNLIPIIIVSLLGFLGTILSFFSMFEINIDMHSVMYFSMLYFVIFTILFLLPRKFHLIIIPMMAVWGLLLFKEFENFKLGYKMLFNEVYANIYPNSHEFFNIKSENPENIEIFLAFVIFLVAIAICVSVYFEHNFFIGFLITFSILEIGLYFGKSPNVIYAFMLIIFWVSLIVLKYCGYYQKPYEKTSGFIRKNNMFVVRPGIRFNTAGLSVTIISIICCIIFTFTALFSNLTGYKRSDEVNALRSNIKFAADEFSFDDFGKSLERFSAYVGIGNLRKYTHKLGTIGSLNFKNKCELVIDSDEALGSNVYLKGYTGAVYTDNEWKDLSDNVYKNNKKLFDSFKRNNLYPQQMLYNYYSQRYETEYSNIKITSEYNNETYNYIPYISTSDLKASYINDTLTSLEDKKSYSFKVNKKQIDNSNLYYILSGADYTITNNFDEYDDFVYDNYLSVEDTEGLQEVYNKFVKGSILEENGNVIDKLSYIENILSSNAQYTLKPGRTPKNEDFVNYFLIQNHKGYCMHFATAGIMLARMAGIPARYCDGFVLKADDFSEENRAEDGSYKIQIEDNRAHAWAEIYFQGLGWVPYEFTASAVALEDENAQLETEPTTDPYSEESNSNTENIDNISSGTQTNKAFSGIKNSGIDNVENEITHTIVTFSGSNNNAVKGGLKNTNKTEKDLPLNVKITFIVIVGIIVILSIIALRHIIAQKRKNEKLNSSDKSEMIFYAYNCISKLLEFCGIKKENMQYLDFAKYAEKQLSEIIDSEFYEITQVMLKAKLSDNPVDDIETKKVKDYYEKIYNKVYNRSGFIKKIIIRFIKNY